MSSSARSKTDGLLVIISAPSGCGKTTIVDRLLKRHPDWTRSISATTREARAGEKEGVDYFFMAPETFQEMKKAGHFLEDARVFDSYYGTPKNFVISRLKEGKKVLLAIDVQGAKQLMKNLEGDIRRATIFILPPSIKVLRDRLEGRKTDSAEVIEKRISVAQEEIKSAGLYQYSVINQNLEQAVLEVEKAIESESLKEARK